jgi:hypothetical protein
MELRLRVLGPEHPDTIKSMHALADCLTCMGRAEEATSLYREGLQLAQHVLGAEHPDTKALAEDLEKCRQQHSMR